MKQVQNLNIESEYPLPTPHEIAQELPLTHQAADTVHAGREQVINILYGDDPRLLILCGPCSIDNPETGLEYAKKLIELQKKVADRICIVMRAYFEKPRTTVGWKGLVYDPDLDRSFQIEKGLRLARKFLLDIAEAGMPAATEFLEPIIPQYIAELISWASIGARTSESQTHRQLASGLSMPIGFKNSTDGSISVAVDAIKTASARHSFLGVINDGRTGVFNTTGNPYCHVVLRGGSDGVNYMPEHIAYTRELMLRKGIKPAIVVDCSHANSQKNPQNQPGILLNLVDQINAGEKAIRGAMLESYLVTGRQEIADNRTPGLSVTDPCIGWEETEKTILAAYEKLR